MKKPNVGNLVGVFYIYIAIDSTLEQLGVWITCCQICKHAEKVDWKKRYDSMRPLKIGLLTRTAQVSK